MMQDIMNIISKQLAIYSIETKPAWNMNCASGAHGINISFYANEQIINFFILHSADGFGQTDR
jgi:hypothetical protein